MSRFDGTLSSVGPAIMDTSARVFRLEAEIESLHQAFDRLGLPKFGENGLLSLGERFESIYVDPTWKKVK